MELWNAVVVRKGLVSLGMLVTAVLYAIGNALLDEYVTLLAGAGGAYAGFAYLRRGSHGPLDEARTDDVYAWGLGTLIGVLAMHTLAQGGAL
jgi:hypothetical protein